MRGHVKERSPGHFAIVIDVPDPVTGKRRRKWHSFTGTKRGAQIECARLITEIEKGGYVDASKLTVGQWIDQWIEVGAPGRRRKKVSQRSLERYGQLLRTHAKPTLGQIALQKLRAPDVDKLYANLAEAKLISARTQHHVHTVLSACLATAHRKGLIANNPMLRVEQIPAPEQFDPDNDDIGEGLSETDLADLIAGFRSSSVFPIVALAAATGARRNELLALRWSDLDTAKKTLRIERALEQTKKFGIRVKSPKTKRGFRTIDLDDGTIAVLLREKERHQRFAASIPDGSEVELSLIRLPADALMFPALSVSFSTPRHPRNFSRDFSDHLALLSEKRVKDGLAGFTVRFHDLRGIHATALLDAGVALHTVAQRIGDDPATLLRFYTKRKRSQEANEKLSDTLSSMAAGFGVS